MAAILDRSPRLDMEIDGSERASAIPPRDELKVTMKILTCWRITLLSLVAGGLTPASVHAQPIGIFKWQLQPFCNVVTLNVAQQGGVYTLDGYDDQCGAAQRAPTVGLAVLNPDGTVGIGLTIVTTPGGTAVHVDAAINMTSLGGTWTDSLGHTGTFVFTPGAGTGGSARPVSASGTNLDYQVVSNSQLVQTGSFDLTASCPGGKRAIGGGYGFSNPGFVTSLELIESSPITGGVGWRIRGNTANSALNFLAVRAVCIVVQ